MHLVVKRIQIRQHLRVFNADDHDRLERPAARTFKLHRVGLHIPHRSFNACGALIHPGIARRTDVEHPARVRSGGSGRCSHTACAPKRFQASSGCRDSAAPCRTLPCRRASSRRPAADSTCIAHRTPPPWPSAHAAPAPAPRISGTAASTAVSVVRPAQHDVGSCPDGGDVRLGPHQRNDVLAGEQLLVRHRPERRQRRDLAVTIHLNQFGRILLAVKQCDLRRDAPVPARPLRRSRRSSPRRCPCRRSRRCRPAAEYRQGAPSSISTSRSRFSDSRFILETPRARYDGPLSVEPASTAIAWAPWLIPYRTCSRVTPPPSMPTGTITTTSSASLFTYTTLFRS